MPCSPRLSSTLPHKAPMSSALQNPTDIYPGPTDIHPGSSQARSLSPEFETGVTEASSKPGGKMSAWMATLRDFSPFAFASPALEQQYQDYQSAHVGSHVGTMCWLLATIWAAMGIFAWLHSLDYPRAWLFNLPLALCVGVGVFSSCAPVTFRRHWHTCSFAIFTANVLMDDEVHTFMLAHRMASGRLHSGMLLELEFYRLLSFSVFAVGCPLSLPAWGVAQALMFVTPSFTLAGKCRRVGGSECAYIPWPVFSALQTLVVAYSGTGGAGPGCQVCVIFWKVQMEMMGAVFRVLRDVAWRRAFLRGHSHLLGADGAARATAWPFGSPHTIVTCSSLVVWLVSLDVMAIDFWVSAIVRGGYWGP